MMVPLIVYGWRRVPPGTRLRAGVLFLACATAIGVAFLVAAPDLAALIWQHFIVSTAASRLGAMPAADMLERVNHNLRDMATAGVVIIGVINVFALIWWVATDRRLPQGLSWVFAALWTLPWLFLCSVVHIGKPGYLLPLLPFTSLLLAGFYVRRSRSVCTALVLLLAVVNSAHFVALGPFSDAVTGGMRAYRAKTLVQKAASDLQPLTVSTVATIRRSDARMARILDELDRCQSPRPVIVAGGDLRRVMWYVPDAIVIYVANRKVQTVAVDGYFTPLTDEARVFSTTCPVLWVSDGASPELPVPEGSTHLADVGFVVGAHQVRVSRSGIEFD
jgi:hypothetical protein